MWLKINTGSDENRNPGALRKFFSLRSSIYSRVVFIITFSSIILFLAFGIIFRSVYEQSLNAIITQNGNNIGSIVEGSLYTSMLENDKSTLQGTLDIINTMSGIDDVNMYDENDSLVYSSFLPGSGIHSNPNCIVCHKDIRELFPRNEKSYRIIPVNTQCIMNGRDTTHRHLIIRTPIMNQSSCYTGECHAHPVSQAVLGSLIIKLPLEEVDTSIQKSTSKYFLFATFITVLLSGALIAFTSRQIKMPLNEIVKASHAVANGNKTARLEIRNDQLDDMRLVSQAFNNMLDNLQAASEELKNWSQQLEYKVMKRSEELSAARNELIHIERIASLGKLSSSVAHELNNPLSGILIYTKLIYKQLENPDLYASKRESVMKHLRLIETETKRCGDIVKGLLDFSRKEQEGFEHKHLHEILEETYELMSHPVIIAGNRFIKDFSAHSDMIFCSPNKIKQACVAIIVNSTEAVSGNGEIAISTENPDNSSVRINISDNGIGIPEEDIPHIFEPFFTTKQAASGIGLGLAIVHGIVKSHNGSIDVVSAPGSGTKISITLPLAT